MSKVIKLDPSNRTRTSKPAPTVPSALQLLPPDEHRLIAAYFDNESEKEEGVARACDRLGVPVEVYISRVAAAAGQILVQGIQDELPQWSTSNGNGEFIFGRAIGDCSRRAQLALVPVHLFTINWADSGPGFSWPETYSLVYVPWRERYVVVASQDSTDMWGCTDQAIGHFAGETERVGGVENVICAYWREIAKDRDYPWAYLFDTGLIEQGYAEDWREAVWPEPEPELDEE